MSRESDYIPASDLLDLDSERIQWQVNLPPYAPAENIGVNVTRLERIARIGGFKLLQIGSYDGELSSIKPNGVTGLNEDGSATSTASATATKAKLHKVSVNKERRSIEIDDYKWRDGSVLLNTSEIDKRVGDAGKLRDPELWAKQLNPVLGGGLRAATRRNLIEEPDAISKYWMPGNVAVWTMYGVVQNGANLETFVRTLGLNVALVQGISVTLLGILYGKLKERRYSVVPGVQYDRVLAVDGLTRIMPLIKVLRKNKNE